MGNRLIKIKRLLLAPLLLLLVSCSNNNVNQSKASDILTSSFSEKIDDFDNSTTWKLRLWSENKLPSDVVKEGQALISVTCTKYASKEFNSDFSGSFANFSYPGDLIEKLGKHSTLKIRYSTVKNGEQIAEFNLSGDDNISKLLEKCEF